MGPKRSSKPSQPLVRFRTKRACGSNGKPVYRRRRGRPSTGGKSAYRKRYDAKRTDADARTLSAKERMAGLRSLFRFCSKTYGLTYSDAAGITSKEMVHAHLQTLLGIHHCCVSRELHENGEQHFHVSGRCDHKIETTDCHHFDIIDDDGKCQHPNIVKGGNAWLNYVMKAHDYVTTYPTKPNVMADALACPSTERALDHIMQHDAGSYVKFGTSIEKNLQRHYSRTSKVSVPRWCGPYPAGRYPPNWNPHTHSLHLWGPPGSGKTCFAQHLLREYFGDCDYVKAHIESLKSLQFCKPFVFDEAMFLLHPSATSREITDVVSGGVIHARYNAITIPPGIPRVFVSNQRWVFKNPDDSVYDRRLVQYEMPFSCPIEEWRLHNPPPSPPPPPPPPGTPPSRGRSPPPPPPLPFPDWPEVDDMVTEVDDELFPPLDDWRMTHRWIQDDVEYAARPRPSQAPAIGAAPMPMTPPLPAPATPHWSPGWSPLLPFDDIFDMDTDPFMLEDTIVCREDL